MPAATPAALATSATCALKKPLRAKTRVAAFRIASRLSAIGGRGSAVRRGTGERAGRAMNERSFIVLPPSDSVNRESGSRRLQLGSFDGGLYNPRDVCARASIRSRLERTGRGLHGNGRGVRRRGQRRRSRRPARPADLRCRRRRDDARSAQHHRHRVRPGDHDGLRAAHRLRRRDDDSPAAGRALERRRRRGDVDVPPARRGPLPRRHTLRRRGRAPQFRPGPRPGGEPQAAVAVQHDRPRRGRRSADRALRHQVPVRRLRADARPRLVGDREPGGGGRARQGLRDDRRRRSRAPGRTGSPAGRRTRRWCWSASTATGAIRE